MATARNYRTPNGARFIDSEDSFQKIDINTETFASFRIYEHVRKLLLMKFSKIENLLLTELENSKFFSRCWDEAIKEFDAIVEEVDVEHDLPEYCQIAIVAYTLDKEFRVGNKKKKLFSDFNSKCRNLIKNGETSDSYWHNFPYKSLYALLTRSIHGINNNPNVKSTLCYRGIPDRLTNLKVGDYVFPKQFLSCTIDRDIAMSNLNNNRLLSKNKDQQHVGTLITFEGSPLAACGIIELSVIPDEEEILIFPWNIFKVKEVIFDGKVDRVTFKIVSSVVKNLPYSGRYFNKGIQIRNG